MPDRKEHISSEQKKTARIDYLESLAKWNLFCLELLASLGELHHVASQDRDPGRIFQITKEHLLKIINFDAIGFYLVDEPDSDFVLKYVWPAESKEILEENVERLIHDGSFAWAVNQNRPVITAHPEESYDLVLHVLSTKHRVRGMFAGYYSQPVPHMEETLQYTLSIILQNTANALESIALYNLFKEANNHLENKVQARTADLEDHMVKMKEEIAYRKLAEESLWVARQEAEATLKEKKELLVQFGRELKTPINSILGYSEIIWAEIEKSGECHLTENFQAMQSTGRHILKLIDDIQGLLRNNRYFADIKAEPFSITGLLEGISATLYPLARKNNNVIEVKNLYHVGSIVSDEFRLRQILLLIAGNSCEFTQNGKILIECLPEGDRKRGWAIFRVSDNGKGMKPELLRSLNEEINIESKDNDSSGGLRNGLSFCKQLCARLGGDMRIKSTLGKGTIITLRIPNDSSQKEKTDWSKSTQNEPGETQNLLNDSPEQINKPITESSLSDDLNDEPQAAPVKRIIWLIDEDQKNSKFLCHILEKEGWGVHRLNMSDAGSGNFGGKSPDLVIVGLGVSSEKGVDFINNWVQSDLGQSIPILLFTSLELVDKERRKLPRQVRAILQKGSCTRSELIENIEDILSNV